MDKKETVISEEQKIRTQIKELGARLKSIREAQELSISDISNTTKIQKHYLAAIEEGVRRADAGDFASADEVKVTFGRWGVDVDRR